MVSPSTSCVCFSPMEAGVKITKGWCGYGWSPKYRLLSGVELC